MLEMIDYRTIFLLCSIFPIVVILIALNFREPKSYIKERSNFKGDMIKISKVIFSPKIRSLLMIVLLLVMCPTIGTTFNFYLTEK